MLCEDQTKRTLVTVLRFNVPGEPRWDLWHWTGPLERGQLLITHHGDR